jgi:hypothetical protein
MVLPPIALNAPALRGSVSSASSKQLSTLVGVVSQAVRTSTTVSNVAVVPSVRSNATPTSPEPGTSTAMTSCGGTVVESTLRQASPSDSGPASPSRVSPVIVIASPSASVTRRGAAHVPRPEVGPVSFVGPASGGAAASSAAPASAGASVPPQAAVSEASTMEAVSQERVREDRS